MKRSLKSKILIGVPAAFIAVILVVMVVVSIILNRQNRKVANTFIQNAFSIVRYTISERQEKLLFDSRQMASIDSMGRKIRYVMESSSYFEYDTLRPTYTKIAGEIYGIGTTADVWKANVYNSDGDLMAFVVIGEDGSTLGCVHNRETIEIASLKPDEELTRESWIKQDSLPAGIEYSFDSPILDKEVIRFETIDDLLCLVAYVPVMGKDYNPATGRIEAKQVGMVVAVQKLGAAFVKKMSELSSTDINIFARNFIPTGAYASYKTFALSMFEDIGSGWWLNKQPVIFNDVNVARGRYFQGVLPIYSDSKCIAAIVSLYSKETAQANTIKVIKLLSLVYFVGAILIVPITILMVVRGVINPIQRTAFMMRQIAHEKDFTKMLNIESQDEIGDLASSFNEMTANLKERTTSVDNLNREITKRKRVEDRLRKAEEKYRVQFVGALDAIFVIDADTGIIVDCNPAATRLVGRGKSELIGKPHSILYAPGKNGGEFSKTFKQHLEEKQDRTLETQAITKSGEVKDVAIKANLLEIGGRKVLQGIFRDITESKKAEEEIRRSRKILQDMINAMPFGIMVIGKDKKIKQANATARRLTGYDEDELLGQLCNRTLCPAEENNCPILDQGQKVDHSERKLITKDKKEIPIIKSVVELRLGNEDVLLEAFIDITDRKEAERQLRQLNEDLKDTITKLDRANNELRDFVYIASHDLREPLRKISSFGELLSASLSGCLNDDDKENLGFMIDGAKRMQQMIDALLVYSRVTTRGAAFEPVDLNKVVEELRDVELAVKIEESGAKIMVPDHLHNLNCDPTQIRQLMQNLISNGLTYHKKDVVPEITIRSSIVDNDMVRVEVEDNGIGIKQEYLTNIFVMFKRLHSRREYEGTGIGLAVCKKIVERHRGDIGVGSTYGEGSTFWFTFPASKTPAEFASKSLSIQYH